MKALLQRVSWARVRVQGQVVGEIGPGILVLLGCARGDDAATARALAQRVARYRLFADESGKTNRSLLDVAGAALVVSQFTLAADTRKGLRPSFDPALPPPEAAALVAEFVAALAAQGVMVAEGRFGAEMAVELCNQGPATYLLEFP